MSVKIANAPVSWGVDYADSPGNPPWVRVMREITEAGYRHTELGPLGYYPTDPGRLRAAFAEHGLSVGAGFVFQPLHDPAEADRVLDVALRTVELLSAVGGTALVTIDHISEARIATAGRSEFAERLDAIRFQHMVDTIHRIADIALERGVTPVIHQHVGCYIEFADELHRVMAALDPQKVGVCVDTGHMVYAGIDPVAFVREHGARVRHFHFKDIDPTVHARALSNRTGFLDAVAEKVFAPLGRGVVDWPALAAVLRDTGFSGQATVEQDIDPVVSLDPLSDARASLAFLRSVGF